MKELIGKITASLACEEQSGRDDLIAVLNANIKPPEPIDSSMVYIRALFIVSDQVNSYGGRFPAEDHNHLARLLVDSPVLVGHRKDSLPIARNFHAERVVRDGVNWIKVYFYWLKNAEGGENLRHNIDGGIYKEGSISFVFGLPECTICGRDIRDCPHQPFVQYKTPTGMVKASFNYRRIEKVLETSLVYRGSVENTSIEKALAFDLHREKSNASALTAVKYPIRKIIWNHVDLGPDDEYLVFPAYESIPVLISVKGHRAQIHSNSGRVIKLLQWHKDIVSLTWPEGDYVLDARLIGYRGKERQPLAEVTGLLHGDKSAVTRLALKICDLLIQDNVDYSAKPGRERRTALLELFDKSDGLLPRSVVCRGDQLPSTVADISTRLGCEIFGLENSDRFLLTHRKLISARVKDPAIRTKSDSISCNLNGVYRDISFERPPTMPTTNDCIIVLEVNGLISNDERLVPLHPRLIDHSDFIDNPDDISLVVQSPHAIHNENKYALYKTDDGAFLELAFGGVTRAIFIRHLSIAKLPQGRRFIARFESVTSASAKNLPAKGRVADLTESGGCTIMTLSGTLAGVYFIRPAKIRGRTCLLFGRRDKS